MTRLQADALITLEPAPATLADGVVPTAGLSRPGSDGDTELTLRRAWGDAGPDVGAPCPDDAKP